MRTDSLDTTAILYIKGDLRMSQKQFAAPQIDPAASHHRQKQDRQARRANAIGEKKRKAARIVLKALNTAGQALGPNSLKVRQPLAHKAMALAKKAEKMSERLRDMPTQVGLVVQAKKLPGKLRGKFRGNSKGAELAIAA